jgi:hypothetical protein
VVPEAVVNDAEMGRTAISTDTFDAARAGKPLPWPAAVRRTYLILDELANSIGPLAATTLYSRSSKRESDDHDRGRAGARARITP